MKELMEVDEETEVEDANVMTGGNVVEAVVFELGVQPLPIAINVIGMQRDVSSF
jgi:hypothetical protein